MSRWSLILILTISLAITNIIYSQNEYQIGISAGVVETNFDLDHDIGFGTLISFSYLPNESIQLFLSSGIITWNNMAYYNRIYNNKITPIIMGAKYIYSSNKFQPYFLIELEQIYGYRLKGFGEEVNPLPYDVPGYKNYITESIKFSDLMLAGGLGFNYKLDKNINIETSFVISFISNKKNSDAYHMRLFTGLNYLF